MITKYYNASNNFSAPIIRQPRRRETIVPERAPEPAPERTPPPPAEAPRTELEAERKPKKKGGLLGDGLLGGILDRFEADDLILLGLLLILISDSDDMFLTLIIGYLFIAGL